MVWVYISLGVALYIAMATLSVWMIGFTKNHDDFLVYTVGWFWPVGVPLYGFGLLLYKAHKAGERQARNTWR